MNTMQERIDEYGITADVERADTNPHMDSDTPMVHYLVTLHRGNQSMPIPFSVGMGWTHAPEAADVLDTLALDASGYDNAGSFEEWADEYGYDADSRRAFASYGIIGKQTDDLRRFMGSDYDALVFDTESL
jgi:hypothetical protein